MLPLASSQDHKRAFDGDTGPEHRRHGRLLAGAGAHAGAARAHHARDHGAGGARRCAERKIVYHGVLYAGLMITADGPKVLEFNVRFGDPECQALMLRFNSDLAQVMDAAVDGRLAGRALDWDPRAAVCVVLAAEGYPGNYETRQADPAASRRCASWRDGMVFHAGTARRDGQVVTNGGRVLGVTALGADVTARGAPRRIARVDQIELGRHALPARHRPSRHGAGAMTTATATGRRC